MPYLQMLEIERLPIREQHLELFFREKVDGLPVLLLNQIRTKFLRHFLASGTKRSVFSGIDVKDEEAIRSQYAPDVSDNPRSSRIVEHVKSDVRQNCVERVTGEGESIGHVGLYKLGLWYPFRLRSLDRALRKIEPGHSKACGCQSRNVAACSASKVQQPPSSGVSEQTNNGIGPEPTPVEITL